MILPDWFDMTNADHLVRFGLDLRNAGEEDISVAIACLARGIAINREHAFGHLGLAEILLAQGDWRAGLLEYEWRLKTPMGLKWASTVGICSMPWNGMSVPDGTILLTAEQGYGDAFQDARFIREVAKRFDQVLLCVSPELAPLLSKVAGVTKCFTNFRDVPGHAAHCGLSSLPYLLGVSVDTIPAPIPYLRAEAAKVAEWSWRLDKVLGSEKPRIGLAWMGRPDHAEDHIRSMPLASLLPLADITDAAFISLQKPMPEADIETIIRFPGMVDYSSWLLDWSETAALIDNLDLVITVDTAIAHLAGAMGKPVWILLYKPADWRWLLERTDSPWYPSARLFRSDKRGDWTNVLRELPEALHEFLMEHYRGYMRGQA